MKPLKLVPDNTNIPFMRWRLVALALSLLLVAGSLGLLATKGLNLGVDFKSGSRFDGHLEQAATPEKLRDVLAEVDRGVEDGVERDGADLAEDAEPGVHAVGQDAGRRPGRLGEVPAPGRRPAAQAASSWGSRSRRGL